jgi:salicylate hydroxylase
MESGGWAPGTCPPSSTSPTGGPRGTSLISSPGPDGNVGIHRTDLLALLAGWHGADRAPVHGFQPGCSQRHGRLRRRDGGSADVVIGADGIHSVLQGFVVAPARPVFSGVVAYRGLVPCLEGYPAGTMRMWAGETKHFLVFPVRAGQLLNYVGFVPSDTSVRESWPATRPRWPPTSPTGIRLSPA